MRTHRTQPGRPDPLGATWDGNGTNFALYSEGASGVQLCLFEGETEIRIPIANRTDYVWHAYVSGVGPGQRYGYRVDGPWKPEEGQRFNPVNLLIDPYARALERTEDWSKGAFSYDLSSPEQDLTRATTDQRAAPLSVVVDGAFDWGDDAFPRIPLRRTTIYEAHVRGLTMRHPEVASEHRGTYLGIASPPILRHLRELGITSVELQPVHGFIDDKFLLDRGLRNYWGYNSIAFFAPDVRYRAGTSIGDEVRQFKQMVRALHSEGIEVILDVVYNHSAEGNHLGPTFCFRGIDNPTYYRLVAEDPRHYFDYTGTGNTLNTRHPQTLRLITDSLRYWAGEMHVDGFRFDLAATLARGKDEVDQLSSFFTVIRQDPILSSRKLIAEPWDVGDHGYQVGRFPLRWAEWNGKYRDTIRSFWRGDGGQAAELGYRLTGSSDLYKEGGRSPSSSINFITAHDGFTLRDLVSYDHKHNEKNGEENRDGANDNLSWNCGAEGDTDDAAITRLRRRQVRNFLATLFLSQGTPMLCSGDELSRTQGGNNNAYCQDNETTWLDWSFLEAPSGDDRHRLLDFTRSLIRLRQAHPLIQRANFFLGRPIHGVGIRDIIWCRHDGQAMTDVDWKNPGTSSVGLFMAGSGLEPFDEEGQAQSDDDLLLVLNASDIELPYVLPAFVERGRALEWSLLLDTYPEAGSEPNEQVPAGQSTKIAPRSLKLFGRKAVGPGGLQAAHGAPVSTYRVQLGPGFGFKEARGLLDYLDDLGIGALYTSPLLKAQRGSTHGYDVVDHGEISPELGGRQAFLELAAELRARHLGHLADFVPNHVGIRSDENKWWLDVLENGPHAEHAEFFDIEWNPPVTALQQKLLLPVLGEQFGAAVDAGKISISREGGRLYCHYADRRLPAAPRSYVPVLELASDELALPSSDRGLMELQSILSGLRNFGGAKNGLRYARLERSRERALLQRRLAELVRRQPLIAKAVDSAADAISKSPDRLEKWLALQHFRLSYWRVATEEINYRRFFDINDLAAIRMENSDVFASAHALLFDLIRAGHISGLRLDHTDGLYDPADYFQALQASAREALSTAGKDIPEPLFIVAEKILERGEELPRGWFISGTSGYDFLAAINGVWTDATAEESLTRFYSSFTGSSTDYPAIAHQAKRDIMDDSFSSEIYVLGHSLKRIADASRRARDFPLPSLVRVIRETIAAFSVYRTYVRPDGSRQPTDEARITEALAFAKRKNPQVDGSVFDFLGDVLLLRERGEGALHFAMRFQQLSGPIMAKGLEDTAFYRFNRLVGLNEVGCDPSRFSTPVAELHDHNIRILSRWPLSMSSTTTHDTKRSEDVRARLAVLTELPEEWAAFVAKIDPLLRDSALKPALAKNDAYLLSQSIVGAFPLEGLPNEEAVKAFTERIANFALKAVHEEKLRSSWNVPNAKYDETVDRSVRAALASEPFRAAVAEFATRISTFGAANSLAQLAVRLASPGVADIYQGSESWSFTLVDPDNRRAVDYGKLRSLLSQLRARKGPTPEFARELVDQFADGRIKLHVSMTGLRWRRELPALFLEGTYEPIDAPEHLIAFERRLEKRRLLCIVPRLSLKLVNGKGRWPLGPVWGDGSLSLRSAGSFQNLFTGERLEGETLSLSSVFSSFPVAWLLEQK